MADKIDLLREFLVTRENIVMLKWHCASSTEDPLVRLENSSIVAMAMVRDADATKNEQVPVAMKISGTLERNDIGGQRLYFEGETLLRVRSGKRAGLVVKPERLDIAESAAPAGVQKFLHAGKSSSMFCGARGEQELLDMLLDMTKSQVVLLPAVPVPRVYRMVRSIDKVKPRITGDLITRLRSMAGYNEALSVVDNFNALGIGLARRLAENSLLFPAELVSGGGLTMVDMSSVQDEVYHINMDTVDVTTELMRTDIRRSLLTRASMWTAELQAESDVECDELA